MMVISIINTLKYLSDFSSFWTRLCEDLRETVLTNPEFFKHSDFMGIERIVSEAAWEIWDKIPSVSLTSNLLINWWKKNDSHKAVLILDAFSLNEVFFLLEAAKTRNIPFDFQVSLSKLPSITESFLKEIGLNRRVDLNQKPPKKFKFLSNDLFTYCYSEPFNNCIHSIQPSNNLFIWHSWIDDLLNNPNVETELNENVPKILRSDEFWNFIKILRQNRELIITSDHGYACTRTFFTEDGNLVKKYLKEKYGGSRYTNKQLENPKSFMPPIELEKSGKSFIIGPRKWRVSGGFSLYSHGGATFLEVCVPFIKIK